VKLKVMLFYMDLFESFEKLGTRIDNPWHMFTLQYSFMPRILEDLNLFKTIGTITQYPLNRIEHRCNYFSYVEMIQHQLTLM
jgi:hypothetical protein